MDDHLLTAAKRFAAEREKTLTSVLEQALREFLSRRREAGRKPRSPLPTFKGRGLQQGVELSDSAALLDLMERGDDPA